MPRPSPWNEHCTTEKLWMLTHLVDAGPAACWLALDQARGDVHAAAARLITPDGIERYATQIGLRPLRSPFLVGPPGAAQLALLAYLEQHAGEGGALDAAVVQAEVAASMGIHFDPSVQRLTDELGLAQPWGRIVLTAAILSTDEEPEHDPCVLADRLCLAVNLLPIGEDWIVLPADQARERLGVVLAKDQAYGAMRMDLTNGRRFADRFAALFPADATYLHNHDGEGGSSPVSTATFESAFAIAHPTRVGLALIMDED